jgi:hypothetical protein
MTEFQPQQQRISTTSSSANSRPKTEHRTVVRVVEINEDVAVVGEDNTSRHIVAVKVLLLMSTTGKLITERVSIKPKPCFPFVLAKEFPPLPHELLIIFVG